MMINKSMIMKVSYKFVEKNILLINTGHAKLMTLFI